MVFFYYSEFDAEKKYGWDLDSPVAPEVPRCVSRKYKKEWSKAGIALRKSRVSDYAIYMVDKEKEAVKVKGKIGDGYFERDGTHELSTLKALDEILRSTVQLTIHNIVIIGGLVGQNDAFRRHFKRVKCHLQHVLDEFEDIKRTQAKTQFSLEQVQGQLKELQAEVGVDDVASDVKRDECTFQHAIDFDEMDRSQASIQAVLDRVKDKLGKI